MIPQTLQNLQQRFGSVQYDKWQVIRQPYYSTVEYPAAGSTKLSFFGVATGSTNLEFTNMPKAGSFGQQYFQLKAIRCQLYCPAPDMAKAGYTATNAGTLWSDFTMGMVQAGYLEFNIGAKNYLQITKPLLSVPNGMGKVRSWTAGFTAAGTAATAPAWVNISPSHLGKYLIDPDILIAPEQQFDVSISYPSGAIPIMATGIITGSVKLYIRITLDGLLYRPAQ